MTELAAQLLNPNAGSHPVTTDPREVEASVAAGERSFAEFPYYGERYGERGRAFGHSDSAWLALIAQSPQEQVNGEVIWLATLLAARGMPQFLMERHLELLHEELVARVSERAETYAKLLEAARVLRRMREAHVPAERMDALDQAFAASVPPEWRRRLPRMGALIAAAVADARNGIPAALDNLYGWATDADRFPPEWIDAVEETVRAAGGS